MPSRLKNNQVISHTGLVILDVGMLSGFSLTPGAAAPTDLIRKVEVLPEKVSLYLDSVSVSSCHHLMGRREKLGHTAELLEQSYWPCSVLMGRAKEPGLKTFLTLF